jgi:hypothetical protein
MRDLVERAQQGDREQISAPSPAALSALLPEAMPIVQSFRFAP